MAIEGPLKELGIHDVFQLLDLSKKTGVLKVRSELRANEGRVWFENGAVVFAELKDNPLPLGESIARAGKVTEADISRTRDMQRNGDKRRFGDILVDIGAISQTELGRQILFHTEEVIFGMMNWQEGHFVFEEGERRDIPADSSVTRIRTEAILMEGARRIDEWSRMERKIPHVGVVPTLAADGGAEQSEIDLLPDEWEILAAVDGEHDIRAVASGLARSEFDVAKTLFGLESAGVLTFVVPAQSVSALTGEQVTSVADGISRALRDRDIDAARSLAEIALGEHPQSSEMHYWLARVHRAAGDFTEAEEYCRRALRLDSLLESAHRLLGDVLMLQGRFRDGIEWWERWIQIHEQQDDLRSDVSEVTKGVRAAQTLRAVLEGNR